MQFRKQQLELDMEQNECNKEHAAINKDAFNIEWEIKRSCKENADEPLSFLAILMIGRATPTVPSIAIKIIGVDVISII